MKTRRLELHEIFSSGENLVDWIWLGNWQKLEEQKKQNLVTRGTADEQVAGLQGQGSVMVVSALKKSWLLFLGLGILILAAISISNYSDRQNNPH